MSEPTYGLIVEDDLVWLRQQNGTVCLTPGLEGLERPSTSSAPPARYRCPHTLTPEPGEFPRLKGLARVLRPVPDGGAYYCSTPTGGIVPFLKMSASVERIIFPTWAVPISSLIPQLTLTNLAPLVIPDCEPKNFIALQRLLSLPRTRTIICLGAAQPPMTTRLEMETEPRRNVDWEKVGAAILHDHVVKIVEKARKR